MATLPIVNTQDKRIGAITAVVAMLLVLLIMWLIKYEVVDPPPPDLHLEAAAPLDKTLIQDITVETGGGGGGDPSSDPVNNPKVTEQIITNDQSTTTVNSGNASSTTTPDSDNPPSGDNVDNPFSGGFGGGTGGGQGDGNGSGIGSDSGPGTGPGTGGTGGKRMVLSHVNSNDIHYNYDAKFVFQVGINADGYVVDVRNVKSLTTTSDERIIRKVAALIKQQVRYSKSPGATIQTLRYTVNFKTS
jgi:hypothetical protein